MKVIDLINDYSNGKELPEKIKVHGTEFIRDCYLCYRSQAFDRERYLFTEDYDWSDWLNEEIEIIEEDKKIENNFQYIYGCDNDKIDANFENIKMTLEDIIKVINEMRTDNGIMGEKKTNRR